MGAVGALGTVLDGKSLSEVVLRRYGSGPGKECELWERAPRERLIAPYAVRRLVSRPIG